VIHPKNWNNFEGVEIGLTQKGQRRVYKVCKPTPSAIKYILVQNIFCWRPPACMNGDVRPRLFYTAHPDECNPAPDVRARLKAVSACGLRIPIRPFSGVYKKTHGKVHMVIVKMLDYSHRLGVVINKHLTGAQTLLPLLYTFLITTQFPFHYLPIHIPLLLLSYSLLTYLSLPPFY